MQRQAHKTIILDNYQALGTAFWIECFDPSLSEEKAKEIGAEAVALLATFEEKFSRFKRDSQVSKLNRGEKVPFDQDLFAMLSFAEVLEEKTENLFSLFIGNNLIQKGYGQEEFLSKDIFSRDTEKSFSADEQSIRIHNVNGLDLGGVGKGYVIDLLAILLQEKYELKFFLINGGGDMYVTSDNGEGIQIFLEHPLEKDSYIGSIIIKDQGFASSSSFKRMWKQKGGEVNHFVTKGRDVWGASFVIASNALIADALATCMLLYLPDHEKQEPLSCIYDASFMLVDESGVFLSPRFPTITSGS